MIKTYYLLTKPGIIMGNLITTVAGFALAAKGELEWGLFLATLVGLVCIIASSCIFNNYIDRHIDEKMARTKHRGFVKKAISVPKALCFALFLAILSIVVLSRYTNALTVWLASAGFFIYVVVYSLLKRRTNYGTLIGSISGAIPPVIGYAAVSNRFDAGAWILFLILVLWQMPHFFSIALYRFDDYKAASLPVLPTTKGLLRTKVHMTLYIIAFILAVIMLKILGYATLSYLVVGTLFGLTWLALCLKGFKTANEKGWGRQMFICSLVVITAVCVMITLENRPSFLRGDREIVLRHPA